MLYFTSAEQSHNLWISRWEINTLEISLWEDSQALVDFVENQTQNYDYLAVCALMKRVQPYLFMHNYCLTLLLQTIDRGVLSMSAATFHLVTTWGSWKKLLFFFFLIWKVGTSIKSTQFQHFISTSLQKPLPAHSCSFELQTDSDWNLNPDSEDCLKIIRSALECLKTELNDPSESKCQ